MGAPLAIWIPGVAVGDEHGTAVAPRLLRAARSARRAPCCVPAVTVNARNRAGMRSAHGEREVAEPRAPKSPG